MEQPTKQNKSTKPQTQRIVIEQQALSAWQGKIDLVDGALINHVHVRLTRRHNQRIIVHEGVQCVWVHYPTVAIENWMLSLSPDALKKRFAKLEKLGILVRKRISLGKDKGSQAYYGISNALKKELEKQDIVKEYRDENPLATEEHRDENTDQTFDRENDPGAYDRDENTDQSLGTSQGKSVEPAEPASPSSQSSKPKRKLDPVVQLYVDIHLELFGFEPQLKYAAIGKRLKELRSEGFTDEQLTALIQTARNNERAWYRRDRKTGKEAFELMTILSAAAINQIRRDNPRIFAPPREEKKCPACGDVQGDGTAGMCVRCGLSHECFEDSEAIEECRVMAMFHNRLPIENEADAQKVKQYGRRVKEQTANLHENLGRTVQVAQAVA